MAEGFKQDFNFLWRLLGRVHAARGAIQNLMGEEVRVVQVICFAIPGFTYQVVLFGNTFGIFCCGGEFEPCITGPVMVCPRF